MFYFSLIFGLIIRFIFIPVAGFKADIAFWKGWGLAIADKGIIWLVKNTNYNYPPGFAYILWVINKIYALLQNPYSISSYWNENNLLYLFLIKLITIAADLGIVYLLLKIFILLGKKLNIKESVARKIGYFWGAVYFLNPAVIFDGVYWGQIDQFGLFLFLLSLYFLFKDRVVISAVIFTISFLMKFQNIIFIPLFFLYIFRNYSFKQMIEAFFASILTFLIVISPFWFNREIADLVRLLTINSDWFPWYSLNAFNIWWIASGLQGMKVVDKTLVFAILNAKQVGLLFFSFFYFVACVSLFFSKKEDILKKFILSLTLVVFSFFHLLTQSHERYLFHVLGFFPLVSFLLSRGKFSLKDAIFYMLFSIFFFLNMYFGMFFNYKDQVIWPFSQGTTLALSLYLSILQIGIFAYFIFSYILNELRKEWLYLAGFALIIVTLALVINLPYFFNKPISLTKISPIYQRQDYLSPIYNKTVESNRGVFFWNRLSVNYFFYKKGIGSHADSDIIYSLKGKFSRFKSDFGLDTEADVSAKVYFSVFADGREIYRSQKKGRFDPPSSLNLDIRGVDVLTLSIRKAGESNFGAHADWLEPEIVR